MRPKVQAMSSPLPVPATVPARALLRVLGHARWALAGAAGLAAPALAQVGFEPAWLQQVQQFTLNAARHAMPGQRIAVEVGAPDARLRLAACQRTEPYLPDVARLWGRSRVGLRCLQGHSPWNISVPVTVKVFGLAQVAKAALPQGRVILPGDIAQAEVDLAEDSSQAISNAEQAVGRALLRPVASGQALRQAHLKLRQWFAVGEDVKVLVRGSGFQAVGNGQALAAGIEGQPVRVRTESGRIVTGLPVAQALIEITL